MSDHDPYDPADANDSFAERADPTDSQGKPFLLSGMILTLVLVLLVLLVIGIAVLS